MRCHLRPFFSFYSVSTHCCYTLLLPRLLLVRLRYRAFKTPCLWNCIACRDCFGFSEIVQASCSVWPCISGSLWIFFTLKLKCLSIQNRGNRLFVHPLYVPAMVSYFFCQDTQITFLWLQMRASRWPLTLVKLHHYPSSRMAVAFNSLGIIKLLVSFDSELSPHVQAAYF